MFPESSLGCLRNDLSLFIKLAEGGGGGGLGGRGRGESRGKKPLKLPGCARRSLAGGSPSYQATVSAGVVIPPPLDPLRGCHWPPRLAPTTQVRLLRSVKMFNWWAYRGWCGEREETRTRFCRSQNKQTKQTTTKKTCPPRVGSQLAAGSSATRLPEPRCRFPLPVRGDERVFWTMLVRRFNGGTRLLTE